VLTSALSGIEHALWDNHRQVARQPIYQLMGGAVRDKIRMYGWIRGESYGDYIESAKVGVNEGFTAFKVGVPGPINIVDTQKAVEDVVEMFAQIRSAVGSEVQMGIDFHGRVSPAMSIRIAKALEPYYPMFIEEPVLPENVDMLALVARSTTIPIATGERLFTNGLSARCWKSRRQPCCSPIFRTRAAFLSAGKSRRWPRPITRRLRLTARWGRLPWRLRCNWTPASPISCARNMSTLGEGYIKTPFKVENGFIPVPTGPGLGIELDEEALADKFDDGTWETPRLWHEDGSVADW